MLLYSFFLSSALLARALVYDWALSTGWQDIWRSRSRSRSHGRCHRKIAKLFPLLHTSVHRRARCDMHWLILIHPSICFLVVDIIGLSLGQPNFRFARKKAGHNS